MTNTFNFLIVILLGSVACNPTETGTLQNARVVPDSSFSNNVADTPAQIQKIESESTKDKQKIKQPHAPVSFLSKEHSMAAAHRKRRETFDTDTHEEIESPEILATLEGLNSPDMSTEYLSDVPSYSQEHPGHLFTDEEDIPFGVYDDSSYDNEPRYKRTYSNQFDYDNSIDVLKQMPLSQTNQNIQVESEFPVTSRFGGLSPIVKDNQLHSDGDSVKILARARQNVLKKLVALNKIR